MYEAPEILELGTVSENTLGKRWGNWDDGLPGRLTWIPVTDEIDEV